ncbi:MAG: hypothetical protein HYT43_01560 [Candidatus Taylorbacteria bacterium]|nr:hypothetical protein [Candidatus Taylorbacteria bacterium]
MKTIVLLILALGAPSGVFGSDAGAAYAPPALSVSPPNFDDKLLPGEYAPPTIFGGFRYCKSSEKERELSDESDEVHKQIERAAIRGERERSVRRKYSSQTVYPSVPHESQVEYQEPSHLRPSYSLSYPSNYAPAEWQVPYKEPAHLRPYYPSYYPSYYGHYGGYYPSSNYYPYRTYESTTVYKFNWR